MEASTVKHHIMTKEFQPMYIFTGVEMEVQKIYVHKIAEVTGYQLIFADTVLDILPKLNQNSFFKQNYVFSILDDKDFISDDKLQKSIKSKLCDNILILRYSSLDKRSKLYKAYKDTIVDFEPLEPRMLKKYIQREIELSEYDCNKLIDYCEQSYSRIMSEVDKIKTYSIITNSHANVVFTKLVNDGTIYIPPKDAVFDFVNAVLQHKVKLAFDLLSQIYAYGENTLTLLSVLYTNTKQVLQVQSCESRDIAKATGLTPWQIKCAKDKCNVYHNGDLVYLMRLIRDVEKGIKTGEIDDRYAVPYVLVNFL